MTGSGTAENDDIDWAALTDILDTLPTATFDILLRNVEAASERILAELQNPVIEKNQACILAHELRGMLNNFALVGAARVVREIEMAGGDLERRQEVLPRLSVQISDNIATLSAAARKMQ